MRLRSWSTKLLYHNSAALPDAGRTPKSGGRRKCLGTASLSAKIAQKAQIDLVLLDSPPLTTQHASDLKLGEGATALTL